MKAVVFHGHRDFRVDEVPVPKISDPRDALVKVTLTSICGSDIHIKNEEVTSMVPGQIVGHEFAGMVVEVGSAITTLKPGDRVVGSCNRICGECEFCRKGLPANCINSACLGASHGLNGAQAEYVRVPYADTSLFRISDQLTYEDALFIGDILSTGYMGATYAEVFPGADVAVFGGGPVGMCAMLSARLFTPARIIAIEPNPDRRALILKQGLADYAIDPEKQEPVSYIYELTNGQGVDCSIEAVGLSSTFNSALLVAKGSGNVSTVGYFSEPFNWPLNYMWVKNTTIRHGFVQINRAPLLLKLIECGKISTNFLITHSMPLSEALEGYRIFENKLDGVVKVVLKP